MNFIVKIYIQFFTLWLLMNLRDRYLLFCYPIRRINVYDSCLSRASSDLGGLSYLPGGQDQRLDEADSAQEIKVPPITVHFLNQSINFLLIHFFGELLGSH
jgi:hypothetical protein